MRNYLIRVFCGNNRVAVKKVRARSLPVAIKRARKMMEGPAFDSLDPTKDIRAGIQYQYNGNRYVPVLLCKGAEFMPPLPRK